MSANGKGVLAFFDHCVVVRDSAVKGAAAESIGGVSVDAVKAACSRISGRLDGLDEAQAAAKELRDAVEPFTNIYHDGIPTSAEIFALRAALRRFDGEGF